MQSVCQCKARQKTNTNNIIAIHSTSIKILIITPWVATSIWKNYGVTSKVMPCVSYSVCTLNHQFVAVIVCCLVGELLGSCGGSIVYELCSLHTLSQVYARSCKLYLISYITSFVCENSTVGLGNTVNAPISVPATVPPVPIRLIDWDTRPNKDM